MKVLYDMSEKKVNERLKEYNLTLSQARVLNALYNSEEEEYSFKDLEKMFHVSQQTMAGLIGRLELKGFVYSRVYADDRRIKRAGLTEEGRKQTAKIQNNIESVENWLSSGLSAQEKETLIELLDRIYESII